MEEGGREGRKRVFIVPPNSFLKEEGGEGGKEWLWEWIHACAQVDQQL